MSVIGFDIANERCVTAAAKRGGIDVLLNDESKRETPAVVSFGDKQRFLGSANPKSTLSQIKRKLYKQVQEESDLVSCLQVKTECIEVEKWLNNLSQKNLSPRILSAAYINRAIKVFESNCKHIMRSKPSIPRHDEPVDQRENKRSNHWSRAKGEQHVDSNQKDQPVDSEAGTRGLNWTKTTNVVELRCMLPIASFHDRSLNSVVKTDRVLINSFSAK